MAGQTNVIFVDFEYLQKNSPIYANLDSSDILWIAQVSQDMRMERLLGTSLYSRLKTDIINSGTTTGLYKTLIDDYISPSLVYFIVLDAVDFNAIKFTNKGLLRKSSENSEVATPEELQAYKNKLESFAEYYSQRIVDFLCANITSFPEYSNPGSSADTIHPSQKAYTSTIFIPGKNRRRTNFDLPKN